MDNQETWAKCRECQTELTEKDKVCPKCGSTSKIHELSAFDGLIGRETIKLQKKKTGEGGVYSESIDGWFPSGDPKLTEGVYQSRTIDKEKDTYDQIVKDAKTGELLHEEHMPLSEHKNKEK
ncbi:MAG: zinc ribbon domain-containing protein [Dehalococcoidia bacterium]|nr:MAG: zinc ribbon domain-containing protein [Dehalococcoidia bacterium]